MDAYISQAIYIVFLVITALIGFAVKRTIEHIDRLDIKSQQIISESEVRQLLSDKLDPMKEDITDIKDSLKGLTRTLCPTRRKRTKSN